MLELLVVISIIAVLAGILLPVTGSVMTNARKTQAKSTEMNIVTAIKSFQTDYGGYPMPKSYTPTDDVCFGDNNPTTIQLFDILRADNLRDEANDSTRINTRRVVYIELPDAKNQTPGQSKNGIGSDGKLYDPWGKPYYVGVDANYDDTVKNPYSSNAGSVPLRTGVIVYSWGPDMGTTGNFFGGGGDKNSGTSKDDVISWQ